MEVRRYDDPAAFADRAMPRLLADPGAAQPVLRDRAHPATRPLRVPVVRAARGGGRRRGPRTRDQDRAPSAWSSPVRHRRGARRARRRRGRTRRPTAPGVVGARPEADAFAGPMDRASRWVARDRRTARASSSSGRSASAATRRARCGRPATTTCRCSSRGPTPSTREAVPGHPADEATPHAEDSSRHPRRRRLPALGGRGRRG